MPKIKKKMIYLPPYLIAYLLLTKFYVSAMGTTGKIINFVLYLEYGSQRNIDKIYFFCKF